MEDAKAGKFKALYCEYITHAPRSSGSLNAMLTCFHSGVNNNAAVDTFAESELKKYANLHFGTNAPDIVRMFGMDSEVG